MIRQYPYRLWVKQATGGGKDANGHHIPQTITWVNWTSCRDEPTTQVQTGELMDSTDYQYDFIVLMPKRTPTLAAGISVEVRDASGTVRVSGTVKRFSTDQLHCRLWV